MPDRTDDDRNPDRSLHEPGDLEPGGRSSRERDKTEAQAAEDAGRHRRPSEEDRKKEIAQFLKAHPGIDVSEIAPRIFPYYTHLPGEECYFCHGAREDGPCILSPECRFRYRAGFFTRQGGICPWCGDPLPGHLGMARDLGRYRADVAMGHIIPVSRGGGREEWNLQLLHRSCNSAKGDRVTGAVLALAAEHDAEVLDYLPVRSTQAGQDGAVHLLRPVVERRTMYVRTMYAPGYRFRALCGRQIGTDGVVVHGREPATVTCERCRWHQERRGRGNAPACPEACCERPEA